MLLKEIEHFERDIKFERDVGRSRHEMWGKRKRDEGARDAKCYNSPWLPKYVRTSTHYIPSFSHTTQQLRHRPRLCLVFHTKQTILQPFLHFFFIKTSPIQQYSEEEDDIYIVPNFIPHDLMFCQCIYYTFFLGVLYSD